MLTAMIYGLPLLLAGLANFILALILFFKSREGNKSAVKAFGFYNICLGVWNLGILFLYLSVSLGKEMALVSHKYLLFGMLFIFSSFFHFTLEITNNQSVFRKRLAYAAYFLSGLFVLCSFFGFYWSKNLVQYAWGYYPLIGPNDHVELLYAASFYFYFIYGLVLLWKSSQREFGVKRVQLKVVFWSMLVTFLTGATNFLPVMGYQVYPFGNTFNFVPSIFITYAILRYQIFDIFVLLRKGFIFSVLTGFVLLIYAGSTFLLAHYLLNFSDTTLAFLSIPIAFGTILGLRFIEPLIEKMTDKIFFRSRVNFLQVLEPFGKAINACVDFKSIQEVSERYLTSVLRSSSISILVGQDAKKFEAQVPKLNLKLENVFLDEVIKFIDANPEGQVDEYKRLFHFMKENKIEAFINIQEQDDLHCSMIFHFKLSGDSFSEKEFILSIVPAITASLRNVNFYQLNLEQEKLMEASKNAAAMGVLARGLAHEIKNPLVSVKSFFHLFNQMSEVDRNNFAKIAEKELTRIEALLEKLRHFELSNELSLKELDMKNLLVEVIALVQTGLSKKNIKLTSVLADDVWIMGDYDQIKQVVLNLILNAGDATPEGGLIELVLTRNASNWDILIKDSGCGITQNNLKKIFDPFFTTKKTGTGLGLSIVKNIIAMHRGKIEVASVEKQGTSFTISLPVLVK